MKNRKFLFCSLLLLLLAMPSGFAQESVEDRLKKHVEALAAEHLQGRKAGSEGERLAAEYVFDCLHSYGVEMLTPRTGQDFSIALPGDTLYSQNIVGILEGSDPALRNQYVVVGANLDHLGVNVLRRNGREEKQVFPGADNNASGLSVLLEMAQQLSQAKLLLRRSVVFVAFGASEQGQAGAWYFANRAFSQIDSVALMLDLHQVGRPQQGYQYAYYTGGPFQEMEALLTRVGDDFGFPAPVWEGGLALTSDYLAFYERRVPSLVLTSGRTLETGTMRDLPKTLDYVAMEGLCGYATSLVLEASRMEEPMQMEQVVMEQETGKMAGEEDLYGPKDVDKAPQFFHGDERRFLEQWVYNYLRYPDYAVSKGISGTVMVSFVVEANGEVTHVEIARSVHETLDQEVIRVVSASPKWKPGQLSGRKVRVKYTIPVEFRLEKR